MASSHPLHGVQITFIGPQGKVDVKLVVKEMRYCALPAAFGVAPPAASRDYTAPPPSYGQVENFGGMWMGFAVGAAGVAGVLTGLALAKGFDYLVEKITDVWENILELLASGDGAEAIEDASDDHASDASDEETDDTYSPSSGDASEDEDDPASEIDLAYSDDSGGDDVSGDN